MKPVWLIAALCALTLVGCGSDSSAPAAEAPKAETKTEAPKTEAAPEAAKAEAKNPFVVVAVTDEKDGKASKETLAKDAEKIYIYYKLTAKKGDKYTVTLFLDKTEDPKLEGKVKEDTKEMPGDGEGDADAAFLKPDAGWPAGEYRIDLALNGEVKESVKFKVG